MADDPTQAVVLPSADASVSGKASGVAAPAVDPSPAASPVKVTTLPDAPSVHLSRAARLAAQRLPSTILPAHVSTAHLAATPKTPETTASNRSPATAHWADLGLLGMAATGGIFCWRTRRTL